MLALTIAGLRRHRLRSAAAVCGVALAVALVFAVQLVNANLTGSYEAVKEMSGNAQIEVVGRGGVELNEVLVDRVARVKGVAAAAPLSETDVTLRDGERQVAAHLVGVDERIRPLLTERYRPLLARASRAGSGAVYISAELADRLDVASGRDVVLEAAGTSSRVDVADVLSRAEAPAISHSRIVATSLGLVQGLAAMSGDVDRILVGLEDGAGETAPRRLRAALGPAVSVRPADAESRLLAQASELDRQSAALFSAVSLLLGVLLAYTAMHLSVNDRRREIASLRLAGVPSRALFSGLLCEAAVLGMLGSALGLVLGLTVLVEVVGHTPVYLEQAFPLASPTGAPPSAVVASVALGVLAPVAATLLPAWTVLGVPPAAAFDERAAVAGCAVGGRLRWGLAALGSALAVSGAWLVLAQSRTGAMALAGFLFGFSILVALVAPRAVAVVGRIVGRQGAAVELAAAQLRTSPSRTSALVAIVALTVASLLAVGGVVRNLEDGARDLSREALSSAGLWLLPDQANNELMTAPLPPDAIAAFRLMPEIASVRLYRSTLIDWRDRRVKAFAYDDRHLMSNAEIVEGSPPSIRRELASGRGALLSPDLASDLGVALGDHFRIPTARGMRRFRLAGLVTNYGWAPGAVGLGSAELVRGFGQRTIAAARLDLAPGVSPEEAEAVLRSPAEALGVRVETPAGAERRARETARRALGQLRRIAAVLLATAIVAVGGIMLTTVVQQRRQLGVLRAVGLTPSQLRRSVIAEALLALGLGSAAGICGGLIGQHLIIRLLAGSAGYPVELRVEPQAVVGALAAGSLAALVGGAVAVRAVRERAIPRAAVHE